ncbi:uncharacterized protein LOC134831500 [Culicoides brevitarsis]|uniref:uncharacterized protein LOC134831500 n=1 Tax=Culicoides brevitarsis TaxID=469753 RepID=UPI00307BE020
MKGSSLVVICATLILALSVFSSQAILSPAVCPVYLTVSSYSISVEDSHIIINFGPGCVEFPDWVGIYRQNPSISNEPPLAYVKTSRNISRQFQTDVKFGNLQFPWGWEEESALKNPPKRGRGICLNLFVASYKNNQLLTLDCLKIQPAWMSLEKQFADVPFRQFFIPGTHCAACHVTKSNLKNGLLKKIGFLQNFNIWQQMVFGVRYFDFSIGFQSNSTAGKEFWIMNGNLKITPLLNVLRTIRKFVILSHEPIFMDFYEFPLGFYNHPERHKKLIKLVIQELSDVLYTKNAQNNYLNSYDLTLEMMKRKTLLLMYNDLEMLKEYKEIWPSWRRHSSEYLKISELSEFMKNLFSKKSKDSPNGIGWVFSAVQGYQTSYQSNEKMKEPGERAAEINAKVIPMLGGPWSWGANVVSLDYFMSTNLVDIAIHTNQNKIINLRQNNNMTVVEI